MAILPEPPNTDAPAEATEESQFAKLMRIYQIQANRKKQLDAEVTEIKGVLENAKSLIRAEVQNIGLAKGSTMKVEGVGKFNFTTTRYYSVPPERRAEFIALIIERGEEVLLDMPKKALNDWCNAVIEDYDASIPGSFELPSYIRFFEDTMVPRIVPTKEATDE